MNCSPGSTAGKDDKNGQKRQDELLASEPSHLPLRIPRLASIEELYPEEDIAFQKNRYANILRGFRISFPENASDDAGQPRFYSAPGRTELCGNHTDHNHGKVLAAAINMDCVAAVAPRRDRLVRIVSQGFGRFEIDLADLSVYPEEKGSSKALIRGIGAGLAARPGVSARRGVAKIREAPHSEQEPYLRGFDAYLQSEILPGSGLSSSAAFEVLAGAILADSSGIEISPAEIAKIGQYAENVYFGKPSGLMDQMACALGSIAAIDFRDPAAAEVALLSFDIGSRGLSLVIVNTGGSHADLTDDYAAIPAEMKAVAGFFGRSVLAGTLRSELVEQASDIRKTCGDRAFLRAWHFATENERPAKMAAAIRKGDMASYLAVVRASGDSSWKYLQNLYPAKTPAEQGLGIALALTEDFLAGEGAARVHGGGFAGTIQAYVPTTELTAYSNLMESVFGKGSVFPLRIRTHGVVCIENHQRSAR